MLSSRDVKCPHSNIMHGRLQIDTCFNYYLLTQGKVEMHLTRFHKSIVY